MLRRRMDIAVAPGLPKMRAKILDADDTVSMVGSSALISASFQNAVRSVDVSGPLQIPRRSPRRSLHDHLTEPVGVESASQVRTGARP